MGLQEYNRKRHFRDTPEPRGDAARRQAGRLHFVVQLHHARARHYDFRLEIDGVLRSWAIPRGPSFRPGERRLAVEVEDHPMSYAGFSGMIPEGNYGAGHVAIFDNGTWKPHVDNGDAGDAIRRGRLDFELFGTRLKGRWALVRTNRPASKPQWMLLKRTDEYAADLEADDLLEDIAPPPDDAPGASTSTGRRILVERRAHPEHATPAARQAARTRRPMRAAAASDTRPSPLLSAGELRRRARPLAGRRRVATGEFQPPMQATSGAGVPETRGWVHEWKWAGQRLVAQSGPNNRLWSRNGEDVTGRAPEVADALRMLPVAALIDGALIAVDAQGNSDPEALQVALRRGDTAQLRFVVFDLLAIDGIDVRRAPLLKRKALLRELVDGHDPRLFYSEHIGHDGARLLQEARRRGMPGVVSKRANSPYAGGPSSDWLESDASDAREPGVACSRRVSKPAKAAGASGHDRASSTASRRRMSGTKNPMTGMTSGTTATTGRAARNPGLSPAKTRAAKTARTTSAELPQLTSPDRVVYPDAGYTKRDVFEYYLAVADRLLPEIRGRLLSIVRCPDGIEGPRFFQKHAGAGFGKAVHAYELVENDGDRAEYFHVDDLPGLMNLVQMNALELHVWASHIDTLEQPDRLVFDLDPDPGVGWSDVKKAAQDVRARLAEAGLQTYPRLSGGKGVHVVAPIRPEADWDQVRDFCDAFAEAMAAQAPERYVATMSKAKRKGRIFIDWLRNSRGATAIASWSLRARAGAPIAVPLTWDELTRIRKPARYTLKDAAKRSVPDEVAALERRPSGLVL